MFNKVILSNPISTRLQKGESRIVEKDLIEKYFDRLYPICRSILGKGFRESLEILSEIVPFEKVKFPSGENVLDWTIPNEWEIKDAYITKPNGEKIAKFSEHNLHVMNYSDSVNDYFSLDELKKHIFTVPDLPEHFPYVHSYYKRRWGFSISQNELDALEDGRYKAFIDSEFKPGHLIYGEKIIKGTTDEEILLSSYLCHPQMANHELSGPLTLVFLYKLLKETAPHKYTYRFLLCPENIGAAAFLSKNGDHLIKKLKAGYVLNCLGYGNKWTYKHSRRHNSLADIAASNVIKNEACPKEFINFFPDGSDERQFCSPGFNFPIGLIMRFMYNSFPEYHTSADNKELISFELIRESIFLYFRVLMSLELNCCPTARVQKGSPMLSKSPIPLYRDMMNFRQVDKDKETRIILEILNLADGNQSLLNIANDKNFCLIDYCFTIEKLFRANYLLC